MRRQKPDRSVLFAVPLGGDQVINELVVASVLLELPLDPAFEHTAIRPPVVGSTNQQVAPDRGELLGVVGVVEQLIDQPRPLVGGRVIQKLDESLICRNTPNDVERHAASELTIIGPLGGSHSVVGPALFYEGVDLRDDLLVGGRGRCQTASGQSQHTQHGGGYPSTSNASQGSDQHARFLKRGDCPANCGKNTSRRTRNLRRAFELSRIGRYHTAPSRRVAKRADPDQNPLQVHRAMNQANPTGLVPVDSGLCTTASSSAHI